MGKTFKVPASFDSAAAIRANRRLIDRYHSREIKRSGNPFLVHPTDDLYTLPRGYSIRQLTPAELKAERIEQMAKKYAE